MNTESKHKSLDKFFSLSDHFKWILMILVTGVFMVIIYPNLVATRHAYQLGDVAEKDIKAPQDFFIEDQDATAAKRKQAVNQVLTVYDHDTTVLGHLVEHVNQAFTEARTILETPSPATEAATSADPPAEVGRTSEESSPAPDATTAAEIGLTIEQKPVFEERIGVSISSGAFKLLEKEAFSSDISNLIVKILTEILENGVVANKEILLRESEKGIILRAIPDKTERMEQRLKSFYGLDQSKTMVRIIGQPLLTPLNYNLRNLVVDVSQRLIQPNITLNKSETAERRKNAAENIKPILYQIKAGEMLLREGERVTEVQLLKLNASHTQTAKENVHFRSIGAAIMLLCLLLMTYTLNVKSNLAFNRYLNKNLLCLATLFSFYIVLIKISGQFSELLAITPPYFISNDAMLYGIPLASGSMIVCLFMGLDLALPFALIISVCTAIVFQGRLEIFIYFLLNSVMAAYWIKDCRERKAFIKAGLKLSLLNIVLALATQIYLSTFGGLELLWVAAFAFLGGIGSGIVTTGLAPLIELAFDYTTDIKLLELSNLDRPILRRLMLEAPGTYHHSFIVGSMVEAAASEIGANPLLAKVSGYYHDIGKIKKPLYFIENQKNGKNPHDKLAPSMSGLILIAHVKNGVELAREIKLGQVITDTIEQHHGTSLISFFYEKATQIKGANSVNIDDYRYPGPKPQTKEAGLVMLADVVEAASRTLENPTPSRIQGLVQNLTNKIFSDGQLDNCELTLKDLHKIAKSFNKILTGIHHHRIEYPEKRTPESRKKRKNGSADKQPSKPTQDQTGDHSTPSTGHLKRLGLP